MSDLKACPFCQSAAVVQSCAWMHDMSERLWFAKRCLDCGYMSEASDSREKARENWNALNRAGSKSGAGDE